MTSGDLERDLRDCLTCQAAATPPAADRLGDSAGDRLAGAAVARARRIVRRRQAGVGALAVALVAALTGVAFVQLAPSGHPAGPGFVAQDQHDHPVGGFSPTSTVEPEPDAAALPGTVRQELLAGTVLPVDAVVDGRLLTATGSWIDLTTVGDVDEVYRVTGGWLVLSGRSSLWYAVDGAAPRRLLTDVDGITVASDGDRVAWRAGTRIRLAAVRKGRLVPTDDLSATAGVAPVRFAGNGLLLARAPAEDTVGSFTVWWPGQRRLSEVWRTGPGIYGSLPDGRTIVAQVSGRTGRQPCLALLDALAELKVIARACKLPLRASAVGWLSPDGRWLVAEGVADTSVLIDLSSVFGERATAVDAGPRPYGPGAWTDARTVVHGGRGHLVRLHLDRVAAGQADAVQEIPVQGGADARVLAVPRLPG